MPEWRSARRRQESHARRFNSRHRPLLQRSGTVRAPAAPAASSTAGGGATPRDEARSGCALCTRGVRQARPRGWIGAGPGECPRTETVPGRPRLAQGNAGGRDLDPLSGSRTGVPADLNIEAQRATCRRGAHELGVDPVHFFRSRGVRLLGACETSALGGSVDIDPRPVHGEAPCRDVAGTEAARRLHRQRCGVGIGRAVGRGDQNAGGRSEKLKLSQFVNQALLREGGSYRCDERHPQDQHHACWSVLPCQGRLRRHTRRQDHRHPRRAESGSEVSEP